MNEHFSPGAAIIGLVFIVLGTLFLLDDVDVLRMRPMLVLPILLIGLGVGLLLSIREPVRRRHREP